jgi:hypothetical protein
LSFACRAHRRTKENKGKKKGTNRAGDKDGEQEPQLDVLDQISPWSSENHVKSQHIAREEERGKEWNRRCLRAYVMKDVAVNGAAE